jgi:single-strand DNA-binding protein
MNSVTIVGTLTSDPEMRNGGDTKVCSMRLAELNGRQGSPLFIDVAAFGRQAETCGEHLKKGRHVAVSGRLRFREWKTEEGGKRSQHSIAADKVDFLPGGKRGEGDRGGESEGE